VCYQGVPGAFGEEAAVACFGEERSRTNVEGFDDVFAAVARGDAEVGVVPIENALAGSVLDNYDLLLSHRLVIVREVVLPVVHCLLAPEGTAIADVTHCYSHPQALMQCAPFLRSQGIEPRAARNTAGAARDLAADPQPGAAAIASERAGQIYGLRSLATGIQSRSDNRTRFFAIARHPDRAVSATKASLVFSTANEPGALLACLKVFSGADLNLTKLESRPTGDRLWEYHFHADLERHDRGPVDDATLEPVLEDLRPVTRMVRLLGAYPRST
jgi:prephenate dehydratase